MTTSVNGIYGPAIFSGLSDALQAAIDTGNSDELAFILEAGNNARENGVISQTEYDSLVSDAQDAGHDV